MQIERQIEKQMEGQMEAQMEGRMERQIESRSKRAPRRLRSAAHGTALVFLMSHIQASQDPALVSAEAFIDAFYSWDAQALVSTLDAPAEQRDRALYYQAWAQAANYGIQNRRPCVRVGDIQVACRITVTDDFGQTLGYVATDTFSLTVEENNIVGVTFEGDDPPIFDALFEWIGEHRAEVMTGPCKDLFDGGATPAACARAVVRAAKDFVGSSH